MNKVSAIVHHLCQRYKKKLAMQCQCLKKAVQDLSRESIHSRNSIVDVERIFSSTYNLVKKYPLSPRSSASEPSIQYVVDYDDLCGPWSAPDHPTFKEYDDVTLKPVLCTWKFITVHDIKCMKQHLFDKNAIKSIMEHKLPDSVIFGDKGKEIFLGFAWEIFKYMRDDNFSGKGISSILGLFYLTHRFFLSNAWHSADETYTFFKDGVNLHAFLEPPKSDMIFNFSDCDKLLDMFWTLYINKLEIVRSVCIPKINLILRVEKCNVQNYEKSIATENFETQM